MEVPLDYKIGQMLLCGFRGTNSQTAASILQDIKKYHLGGVWLTDADGPLGVTAGNIESPGQLKSLIKELNGAADIPLFVAIDAEGGQVIRLKEAYGFAPTLSAAALGRADDQYLTFRQAWQIAMRLKELGINFNLAPVVDLSVNPSNTALTAKERCFSADPQTVIRHARQVIRAQNSCAVFSCLKHFPGHGGASGDTHHGFVDASAQWQPIELLPFKKLIAEGLVDAVLVSHLFIRAIDPLFPVTFSSAAIRGLLRREIRFKGLVLSDDLNMGAIRQNYPLEEVVERSLLAGLDILVFSNHNPFDDQLIPEVMDIIKKLVHSGRISLSRIEQSYRRIMRLKQKGRWVP